MSQQNNNTHHRPSSPSGQDARPGPPIPGRPGGAGGGMMRGGQRFMREPEKPKDFRKTILRLFSYFNGQWHVLGIIFVLSLGATTAALLSPFLIGNIIDGIAEPGTVPLLGMFFIMLPMIYLFDAFSAFLQNWVVAGASQRLVRTMRASIFKHLQYL